MGGRSSSGDDDQPDGRGHEIGGVDHERNRDDQSRKYAKERPFLRTCQLGKSPNDFLASAGFEIEFEQDDDRVVREVTLRLNRTWMNILEQVLDRKKA